MVKKLLILSIVSLACLGVSLAAVENIKISGDITAQGVMRDLSLGGAEVNNIDDAENFLLSQVRLRLDADLTEEVSAVVRLINERLWGEEDAESTDIDLDLAYLELKQFLYQPLTLTIGRQELRYGNSLIIGDPDTNQQVATALTGVADDLSLRKSFDAVKAILDFSPWTLDLIYAQVTEGQTYIGDDVRLMGGQLAYTWNSYNGISEAYFWAMDNNRDGTDADLITTQPLENQAKTYVVGGRMQFNPIERLMLSLEGAYQFGDVYVSNPLATSDYQHLSAFAAQVMGEYHFDNEYKPILGLRYSYLSGDDDPNDDNHNSWDPMFEDQIPAEIINILFPNTNAQTVSIYGSMMPRQDITLGLQYTWTKLAHNLDGSTYRPRAGAASTNVYAIDRNETYLGSEIDAYMLYDYTEDVQFKLTGAWFIPGDFFLGTNDNTAYSLKAGVKVNF